MTQEIASNTESGWHAELQLGFKARPMQTYLASRKQRGPLVIQRLFYPEGDVCHAYIVHPPGGVVGGDELRTTIEVDSGAHALLTTPGATKFYRSAAKKAIQQQVFSINDGILEWLPQESIFFKEAHVDVTTKISLKGNAAYIGWEVMCLGRPVNKESFSNGQLTVASQIYRDNIPLFIDRLIIQSDADLLGSATLRGQPVIATMLITPATSEDLEMARQSCEPIGLSANVGCTLINEVLIIRYLGSRTFDAHEVFRRIWRALRPNVLHRDAVAPRIWNT